MFQDCENSERNLKYSEKLFKKDPYCLKEVVCVKRTVRRMLLSKFSSALYRDESGLGHFVLSKSGDYMETAP